MSDKPTPALNLDTLEREGGTPEPYIVELGGRVYSLVDPKERDYADVLQAQREIADGNTLKALEIYVAPEDRNAFFANRLPGWKIDALIKGYHEHFGLPVPGESSASRT